MVSKGRGETVSSCGPSKVDHELLHQLVDMSAPPDHQPSSYESVCSLAVESRRFFYSINSSEFPTRIAESRTLVIESALGSLPAALTIDPVLPQLAAVPGHKLGCLQSLLWRCWSCDGGNKNKRSVAGLVEIKDGPAQQDDIKTSNGTTLR